jgi:hypothetical protein
MEKQPGKIRLGIIALLAWAGVILQFYITTASWSGLGLSSIEGTIRFFSYFTILTNMLVALSLTTILARPQSKLGVFFSADSTQAAIAVYIFVVGMIYNLILRNLWAPQGLQLIVDNILHSAVPLIYVLYWIAFVPKGNLIWNDAVRWLYYPALYFLWVIIFGALTSFYPYPFIDVNVLGYPTMFMHAAVLLIVFLSLGFLAIAIGKIGTKKIESST